VAAIQIHRIWDWLGSIPRASTRTSRARLIFIFRLMKVDTVFCYDPWGHYEENPDHYVTASCVSPGYPRFLFDYVRFRYGRSE
jgi:hypothetical protein